MRLPALGALDAMKQLIAGHGIAIRIVSVNSEPAVGISQIVRGGHGAHVENAAVVRLCDIAQEAGCVCDFSLNCRNARLKRDSIAHERSEPIQLRSFLLTENHVVCPLESTNFAASPGDSFAPPRLEKRPEPVNRENSAYGLASPDDRQHPIALAHTLDLRTLG
jgi:hypothetical protein